MRGAPQLGFSATIRKISSRTSLLIGFLPTAWLAREIQLQYSRNPARCQRTTVSGLTRINDFFQPEQTCRKTTRTAGRRNSVEDEVAWRAEPGVIAEARGSPGGVLLGSERRRGPSRADVEGAQTSGDHSEERAAQVRLELIDSADVQSFGEAQVIGVEERRITLRDILTQPAKMGQINSESYHDCYHCKVVPIC